MSQVEEFKKAYEAGQESKRHLGQSRWLVFTLFAGLALVNGIRYYLRHDTVSMFVVPIIFLVVGAVWLA